MKQIIPCNTEMYAVYWLAEGEECRKRVLAFGINDDGAVVPLMFDEELGLDKKGCYIIRYELVEDDRKLGIIDGGFN